MIFFSFLLSIVFIITGSNLSYAQALDSDILQEKSSTYYQISTVKSGLAPKGMECDHSGQFLYVANLSQEYVDIFKINDCLSSNKGQHYKPKKVRTPKGPGLPGMPGNAEILFTFDNQFALASRVDGFDGNKRIAKSELSVRGLISVINTKSQKVVRYYSSKGNGTKIMAQRPKTRYTGNSSIIYTTNWFTNDIAVIDLSAAYSNPNQSEPILDKSAKLIKLKTKNRGGTFGIAPRGIAFTKDGRYAIALGFESKTLIIIDAINHKQIAELPRFVPGFSSYPVNFRHIVLNNKGDVAYLSHMSGNCISKISITKLVKELNNLDLTDKEIYYFNPSIWTRIFIPWKNKYNKYSNVLLINDYRFDHPDVPNRAYSRTDPNTIVLDPIKNRYLFVSCRSGNINGSKCLKKAKVDVFDTFTDERIYSFEVGPGATALAITPDGKTLISSSFYRNQLYFLNAGQMMQDYENSVKAKE